MRLTIAPTLSGDRATVRRAVRLAFDRMDADRPDVEVHVKRARPRPGQTRPPFSGRAYPDVPAVARVAAGIDYLVTLSIPDDGVEGYPYVWTDSRVPRSPTPTIESWVEGIVYLAGHEARHVRQFVLDLPLSEVDANAGGLAVLRAYRQEIR